MNAKTEAKLSVPKWEPSVWEYLSEATQTPLIITEATAADCFTFEQKAANLSSDAAADWIISQRVTTGGDSNTSINPITATELGLTFPDKVSILQIIKMQEGLSVEPLDGRNNVTTKHFKINHLDFIDGVVFKCEDPPFNHRAADYFDIPTALAELAKNNIVIEWKPYGVEAVTIGQAALDRLPYFVGDVGIKHFSQLLSRVPKKKKLSGRSNG